LVDFLIGLKKSSNIIFQDNISKHSKHKTWLAKRKLKKGSEGFVFTCFTECDSSKRVKMQEHETKQRMQKKGNKKS
jgi:hypothetical protein